MIEARVERGYLASRIYQDVENPEALCLEEDWSSEPELKSHICSSSFTELLMLMETAPEAPVLEVRLVSEVRGLEYIEAVPFGDSSDRVVRTLHDPVDRKPSCSYRSLHCGAAFVER